MKTVLLQLAILLALAYPVHSQMSVHSETGIVYDYDYEKSRYQPKDYGAVGINYQHLLGPGLHHFEMNATYRLDAWKGIYLSAGIYLNPIPIILRPDKNLRWLMGIGMNYSSYQEETDYYLDTRLCWTYLRFKLDAGARVNLVENFYYGPTPEIYLRVGYSFMYTKEDGQPEQRWRK